MSLDVVQAVRDGKGIFQWKEILREHNSYKLFISVMRDAMKFNDVPAMEWDFDVIDPDDLRDGVRLPATAHQLQQIADLLHAMLMTPVVIEELSLQAELMFNAVINDGRGGIVANMPIHQLHDFIEAEITKLGGDDGEKLIACVGKYWCLINALLHKGKVKGDWAACNFGWIWKKGATGYGVTRRVRCWQRPGYKHNKRHWDPSQIIRLMLRIARLIHPNGHEEHVDLHDIAANAELAPLIHHNKGTLNILRQRGVELLEPLDSSLFIS